MVYTFVTKAIWQILDFPEQIRGQREHRHMYKELKGWVDTLIQRLDC
jgi:hypothetical protein